MPAPLTWGEALPELLFRLGAAQEGDRKEEAIGLRLEILSLRLGCLSDEELPSGITTGDLKLLYNQGQDLRALGRHADALRAWDLGREYAGYCGDDYSVKLFGLLGAHCQLDALANLNAAGFVKRVRVEGILPFLGVEADDVVVEHGFDELAVARQRDH